MVSTEYMNVKDKKIPKVIHYVWVGNKEMTPLARKCVSSWKKYLSDYEFKFWNESNSPMDNFFIQNMYKKKKWAFVADYIRFWVLEKEGGIYLDMDTEVLKSFDSLLNSEVFLGKTKDGMVATGVIGAVPQHNFIRDILNTYDKEGFSDTVTTSPEVVTSVLSESNYSNVKVYDYTYFNPCDDGEKCGKDKLLISYTNNHWAESWVKFSRLRKLARRVGLMKFLKKFMS